MGFGFYVNHIAVFCCKLCLVDDKLLNHLNEIAYRPEQNQSAGRVVEQEEENQRQAVSHKFHLAGALGALHRSAHLSDFSVEQLRKQIDYGQHADVVSNQRNKSL